MILSDALYLWRNRERPRTFKRWFKVWFKRVYHLPGMCRHMVRPFFLRWRGASIGYLVVLGKSRIGGQLTNLAIGDESSLGRCELALHDRISIGRRVVINDGALLLTGSHSLTDPQWGHKKAPIVIGDYAWIATNAIVLPGVNIGRGAVVGAGAVVRHDVQDYTVVTGNPAMVQSYRRTAKLSYSPAMLNAPFEAWVGSAFNKHQ